MEIKINVDTKTIAQALIQEMIMNLHNDIMTYTQRRFSPHPSYGVINNRFGMGSPVATKTEDTSEETSFGLFKQAKEHPLTSAMTLNVSSINQPNASYYDQQKFQPYRELLLSISHNQLLMETIEKAIASHVEIFLNLGEPENTVKETTANS